MPNSWFFEIYEDTPEQEASNMMQHSASVLDISSEDDAATKALGEGLATAFQEKLADPALVADGSTVFGETASLGTPTYSVDPATLLGDEIETFDMGASASGTAWARSRTTSTGITGARPQISRA